MASSSPAARRMPQRLVPLLLLLVLHAVREAHAQQDPTPRPFLSRRRGGGAGGGRPLGQRAGRRRATPFATGGDADEADGARGPLARRANYLTHARRERRRGLGRYRPRMVQQQAPSSSPGPTSLLAASRRAQGPPAAGPAPSSFFKWPSDPLELFQEVTAALNHSMGLTRPRPDLPPRTKLGFLKTHKTGSTSVAGSIFRFGARNGLRHYQQEGHLMEFRKPELFGEPGSWDLIYNHYSGIGYWQSPELGNHDYFELESWYRRMLGEGSAVTTIMRRPVPHYLSHFFYFLEPQRENFTLAKYLREGHNNPLANEFGVNHHNPARVDAFLNRGLKLMDTVMLMERMGESLVVLRHLMNWELRDLTSLVMYKSSNGAMRYDGRPIQPTPKASSLDPEMLKRVQHLTALDKQIYDASEVILDQQVSELRSQGVDVEAEVDALASLNGALESACGMVREKVHGWWRSFEEAQGYTANSKVTNQDIIKWLEYKRNEVYPSVKGAEEWESMGMLCWWYSLADTCYEKLPSRKTSVAEAVWGVPPYKEQNPGSRHTGEKGAVDMKKWNWFELMDFEHCECRGKGAKGPPCMG